MRSIPALTVMVLMFLARLPATALDSSAPLPFRLHAGSDIVVAVMVEGRGPFDFLLDTGSSRSAISTEVARLLQRSASSLTRMVTPSGDSVRPIMAVKELRVGAARAVDLPVIVLPRATSGGSRAIDGLIGQDVLASMAYTIDYERRRVTWLRPDATVAGTRLPLEFAQGRFVVLLPQSWSPNAELRLIPDSGADGLVLFTEGGKSNLPVRPLDVAMMRSVTHQQLVWRGVLRELRVGEVNLRDATALLVDKDSAPILGDGLLPLHLFCRVTFNGPERFLIVGSVRRGASDRP